MNHVQVLKKAWQNVWRYRTLWIFGIILAMGTVSSEALLLARNNNQEQWKFNESQIELILPNESRVFLPGKIVEKGVEINTVVWNYKHQLDDRPYQANELIISYDPPNEFSVTWVTTNLAGSLRPETQSVPVSLVTSIITGLVVLVVVLVIWRLAVWIGRYVSEVSLIRMVDASEESGQKIKVRQGFRMGWSKAAWRIFLINLVIDLTATLAILALLALAIAPILLVLDGGFATVLTGALFAGSMFLLAILVIVAVATALSAIKVFIWRACALQNLGVFDSIRYGFKMVFRNFKDVLMMWLVNFGIRLVWPLALLPVVVILVAIALPIGGLPGIVTGGVVGLLGTEAQAIITGAILGGTVFMLVLIVPMLILEGLREVFLSSMWTLTYRSLLQKEGIDQIEAPESDAPVLEMGETN